MRIFFFLLAVLCTTFYIIHAYPKSSRILQIIRVDKQTMYQPRTQLFSDLSSEENESLSPIFRLISLAQKITSSTFYAGIETTIVLGLLTAIDGGFSGDWTKLGLIDIDLESSLKRTITSVGLFHLICAPIAALRTASKKQPVIPAVLHTLLIGGLGLGRVLFQTKETLVQAPNVKQSFANVMAGQYDVTAVSQSIDDIIDNNAIVIFAFSTCPFCVKAKDLLIDQLEATVKVVDLDTDKKVGYPIRAELCKRTGRSSVPSIWVGGQFIGGFNDGPLEIILPPPPAPKKKDGFNLFSFLDKKKDVQTVIPELIIIQTKGGVNSLNKEGFLPELLKRVQSM